jgi:hypothetical protein
MGNTFSSVSTGVCQGVNYFSPCSGVGECGASHRTGIPNYPGIRGMISWVSFSLLGSVNGCFSHRKNMTDQGGLNFKRISGQ